MNKHIPIIVLRGTCIFAALFCAPAGYADEPATKVTSLPADESPRNLRELIGELKHESSAVRYRAVKDLSKLGPQASDAVSELKPLLNDTSSDVRLATAMAIEQIGPAAKSAAGALADALLRHGDDIWIGISIIGALSKIQPRAALCNALNDKNGSVVITASTKLAELGPAAKDSVPKLLETIRARKHEDYIGTYITDALKRIDPEAQLE
jgi:hypothetical protein